VWQLGVESFPLTCNFCVVVVLQCSPHLGLAIFFCVTLFDQFEKLESKHSYNNLAFHKRLGQKFSDGFFAAQLGQMFVEICFYYIICDSKWAFQLFASRHSGVFSFLAVNKLLTLNSTRSPLPPGYIRNFLLITFSVLIIAWATQRLVKLMYYFNVISGMCVICIHFAHGLKRVYSNYEGRKLKISF